MIGKFIIVFKMREILIVDEIVNKPYSQVTIELNENYNIKEIKDLLIKEGKTKINLVINSNDRKIHYSLQNERNFDFNQLKAMKSKEYVKKIIV